MTKQRAALITGSTKGIGRGIARRLAHEGYAIALNYRRDAQTAADALAEIQELTDAAVFRANVADPEAAESLINAVVDRFGRLDVLVNNAGPFLPKRAFETSVEEWRAMIDGNLSSAFYCSKFALPFLREVSGTIVNIGTLNAETGRGAPNTTAYTVAKTGLVVLTKSMARAEGHRGVRINIVNPGFIETYSTTDDDRVQIAPIVPLGRLGKTDDVAEAVAFLVSELASYITGAVLNVTGGLWV
ncbi:MAG: SDR family NAD(P)-dependent oxidoreductase [Anaerolineae bacterium]